MNIKYFLKRRRVEIRRKKRQIEYDLAIKDLFEEEVELFNKVLEIAKNNRHLIRFDPQSSEILIVLEHMLVILKNQEVSIYNTNGFMIRKFPSAAYELLTQKVEKEAHSERLKLKYDAKKRIVEFINKINVNE